MVKLQRLNPVGLWLVHSTELSGRQRSADMAFFRAQRREILSRVIRTRITDDAGIDHTTYGMQCLGRRRGQWLEIDRIPDISLCRDTVYRLACRCNAAHLSSKQFRDVVLDCLNEPATQTP